MHFQRTIRWLNALAFVALLNAGVSFAQPPNLEKASNLYHENYIRAATAQNAGDYASAETWHRKNMILVDETLGVPPEARVQARYNLASAMIMQDKLTEAQLILDEAQNVADANPHIDPVIRAFLFTNQGSLKFMIHEFKEAEELLGKGLAILESTDQRSSAAVAAAFIDLARVQASLGSLIAAEGNYLHGLKMLSENGFSRSNSLFVAEVNEEYETLKQRLESE